jgi:hypothetical protein
VDFYRVRGAGANPTCLLMDGPDEWIVGRETKYVAHGYLELELDGQKLVETYRDARGRVLETIELG